MFMSFKLFQKSILIWVPLIPITGIYKLYFKSFYCYLVYFYIKQPISLACCYLYSSSSLPYFNSFSLKICYVFSSELQIISWFHLLYWGYCVINCTRIVIYPNYGIRWLFFLKGMWSTAFFPIIYFNKLVRTHLDALFPILEYWLRTLFFCVCCTCFWHQRTQLWVNYWMFLFFQKIFCAS